MSEIDWKSLGFNYYHAGENARLHFRNGRWSVVEYTADEYVCLHISAACLHYGLEAFEGMKAFRGEDGKVRLFRCEDSGRRLIESARRLCLPEPDLDTFVAVCEEVVRRNWEFIPPYSTGASLYLRPLLIGTKPCLGVRAVNEATLIIFACPIGPYFKEGIHPTMSVIDRSQDRAAPRGTGDVKIGANYAASILSGEAAHANGYASVLYTDAKEHQYIEEFGAANFFAIRGNAYITPDSTSVLPSITNRSFCTLAQDMGMTVERRPVAVDELSTFDEVGACGTGAVISPVSRIVDADTGKVYNFSSEVGPRSLALYNALQDIQYGRSADRYGWTKIIE